MYISVKEQALLHDVESYMCKVEECYALPFKNELHDHLRELLARLDAQRQADNNYYKQLAREKAKERRKKQEGNNER